MGLRVFWRQLTSAPAAVLMILVATLLTALFITAVPRILERVSEDDLREGLEAAEPEQRNIKVDAVERIGAGSGGDPFAGLARATETFFDRGFPESVKSVIGDSHYLVDTPPFRVTSFPDDHPGPFPTTFRFRYQQGLDDRMTLVAGSLPAEAEPIPMLYGPECPSDRLAVEDFVESPDVVCFVGEVPVFEAALTAETAEAMMVEVGDQLYLRPDPQDRLWLIRNNAEEQVFVLSVSGLVELSDQSQEYWYADTTLHRPRIVENPDFRIISAAGVMAPESYGSLVTTLPADAFRHTWRYFVDPDLIEGSRAEELRADVSRILPLHNERITTFLEDLIDEYLGQRALTVRLMSTSATGLLVAAVGVVLALAALIAERHSGNTVLVRDRGASRGQLALTAFFTGLLLVVPAASLGFLITTVAIPDTGALASGRGSAVLGLGGTAAVAVAGSRCMFRRLGALQRRDVLPPETTGKRVVLEVFVLISAAAAVGLLRRRGLADPSGGNEGDFDMLLAAAPAAIGLGAGLLAIRLLTPLMKLLSWLGALGRDAVAFVGFRRLVSMSSSAQAPTLVVLLAVGVAVFSSVVRDAIAEGQDRHTWQVVGADFRIERPFSGAPLPAGIDPEQLAEGRPWAEAAEFPDTAVRGLGHAVHVTVLAIDAPGYLETLEGSGTEVPNLDAIATELAEDAGPAPVLVSTRWDEEGAPSVGTGFVLEMGSVDPEVVVAGAIETFPSLPVGEPFVVMGLAGLREALLLPIPATAIYLRAPAGAGDRLAASLEESGGPAFVASRYETGAKLAGDPLALWLDRGLASVFYLSLLFAIVAALSLLTVTASRRRRELGYLRTLGLTMRQATLITTLEQIPPLLVVTLLGAATGGAVAWLLAPALDIDVFTGGLIPARIVVEPLALLAITAVMAVIIAGAVISFVAVTRGEDYGKLLRVGED